MKLSAFKRHLSNLSEINFIQPNGAFVPKHFHITEAGLVTRHFIDCGGTTRTEKTANFQVWVAADTDHRLTPDKLLQIIALAEGLFENEDIEMEIEYQAETIGRYGLEFEGESFILTTKQTDCLAKDHCGIPEGKRKIQLSSLNTPSSCCSPNSNCC